MNIVKTSIVLLLSLQLVSACRENTAKYEETWSSLEKHNATPEWFRDAKFGIYFHWSIYTVPAFGHEWYPARMYTPPTKSSLEKKERFLALGEDHMFYKKHERFNTYEFHKEKYGGAETFGYKDFIPGFTCEQFNADEWADLIASAGAKFAGPVAEHHDGYALWDSEVTPFCAGKTGPMRDIVGEMEQALKSRGLKFITTFHHSKNFQHHFPTEDRFRELGMDYSAVDLSDPQYAKMYGTLPEEDFMQLWKDKLKEVIDNYQPDMIWFDSWLDRIPEEHRLEFAAYYLNKADEWDKEVMIVRKQQDLPLSMSTLDHERGAEKNITPYAWLSDDCVSPHTWSYVEDMIFYEPGRIITDFVRTVSKNGQLLLNITPKANGEIPEACVNILTEMGDWLDRNGEGIYATRPWLVANEGDKIHFTASKDGSTLYMFLFGKNHKEIVIECLSTLAQTRKWQMIELTQLANNRTVSFEQDKEGLHINTDDIEWDPYATGLKVTFGEFNPQEYEIIRKSKMAEYEKTATYGERRNRNRNNSTN